MFRACAEERRGASRPALANGGSADAVSDDAPESPRASESPGAVSLLSPPVVASEAESQPTAIAVIARITPMEGIRPAAAGARDVERSMVSGT